MSKKLNSILISQPQPASEKSPYYELAEKYGVKFNFKQFIKVERLDAKEFRHQRINILDFTAIVFTAKTAVDNFFSMCEEVRCQMPETMKYFCVSESVAHYLQHYVQYRKRKIFFSPTGKMDGLAHALGKHNKELYLVPVSDVHNEELTKVLETKKIKYTKSVMFRTVSAEVQKEEIDANDMLVFFSPLGIVSLFKNYPDFEQGETYLGCFGNSTAKTIRESGLRLDCEAPTLEHPSITSALEAFIKENRKKFK